MNEYMLPKAEIQAKPRFSLIWLIPLIAALIGAWLAYTYYSERGKIITVLFDEASGIEARKTTVKYKDVEVGIVQKLSLSADLKTVRAQIEIYNEMEDNLGPDTRFWVVSPRITLRGISGLQTLLSGVNIAMDPGPAGRANQQYIGLEQPPRISIQSPGQAFVLSSDRLGSVNIGSPVYYSQIEVGQITGYKLNPDSKKVDVDIFIHAPYHKEIRTNTRFWNASGFELDVSTQGISARLESLTSFLIGGVAFETNFQEPGYPIDGKSAFKLYNSFKLAHEDTTPENKLIYTMYFKDSLYGLSGGSPVNFQGVKVGQVEKITLLRSPNNDGIRTQVEAALHVDKLSSSASQREAEKLLQSLVEQGLRAQLVSSSLVTGAKYIALTTLSDKHQGQKNLASLSEDYAIIFPTIGAKQSLISFDPSSVVDELNNTLRTANNLIGSDDVKQMLKGLASTSTSISAITSQLEQQGISGEVMTLLKEASKTAASLQLVLGDARKTMGTIDMATQTLQQDASRAMIDARVMMQSAGKAATAVTGNIDTFQKDASKALVDARVLMQKVGKSVETLQKDTSRTLGGINKATGTLERGINATLSEDSALQYRFQQLINDLSEAASSFSVLADTLQRKPNSLILGK